MVAAALPAFFLVHCLSSSCGPTLVLVPFRGSHSLGVASAWVSWATLPAAQPRRLVPWWVSPGAAPLLGLSGWVMGVVGWVVCVCAFSGCSGAVRWS